MMMMMTRDQILTWRWWSRRKEPLRRTNQYHKPRGKQKRRKGRRHTPVLCLPGRLLVGQSPSLPAPQGQKKLLFQQPTYNTLNGRSPMSGKSWGPASNRLQPTTSCVWG